MLQYEIDRFLQFCSNELRLSRHTIKAYRLDLGQLSRFLRTKYPDMPLQAVDRDVLREFLGDLNELKPSSLKRKIASFRSFFRFLVDEQVVSNNPASSLGRGLRKEKLLPKTASISDLRRLFSEASGASDGKQRSRNLAIIELLFSTGIRVGELCGLDIEDFDLSRGLLRIRGKGAKERIVPIPEGKSLEALKLYAEARQAATAPSSPGFFLNRDGNRLSTQSVRFLLRRYCEQAQISKVTPHVFRHTLATMLLEQGTDIRYIQSLLGHSSITTTTIYASVSLTARDRILQENHPRPLLG